MSYIDVNGLSLTRRGGGEEALLLDRPAALLFDVEGDCGGLTLT